MSETFESTKGSDFVLQDHFYGKQGIKLLNLVKNGPVHSVKELEVFTLLTLSSTKDYLEGDNSDIIATDSQKNTVYILAKKHGVKSPEDFGILLCNHFLKTYDHITQAVVKVEQLMWNRVSYGEHANIQKLHNHAFVQTPVCSRIATVTLRRAEKDPIVVSGIKGMTLLKTTQSSFVNFINDAYRTLPDANDRIFSTVVDCSWQYRKNTTIDYDKAWELVKYCIVSNFAGDLDQGIPSPSVQNTLYLAEKSALNEIPAIDFIEMTLPNKHYVNIDFSKFGDLVPGGDETVFLPLDKPSGVIYLKLARNMSKL